MNKQILLNNLTYSIANADVKFTELNLSFQQKRYGIVGDNGIGKTTLLKIIAGLLMPQNGSVQQNATLLFLPQIYEAKPEETVAEVLGIKDKLEALQKVAEGTTSLQTLELIEDDWNLKERLFKVLEILALPEHSIDLQYHLLSGGQKTKILLAKAMLTTADFILYDEPTNNLDKDTRKLLYEYVLNTAKGFLIVTHDRQLLQMMEEIIEITTLGVNRYGGNYEIFTLQKQLSTVAAELQLQDAKKSIQLTKEKHEQRRSKGRKAFLEGKIDRTTANSKKGRSERTASRLSTQNERIIEAAEEAIVTAKAKIEIKNEIVADFEATKVPNGKTILSIKNLCFSYENTPLIFDNFNLEIIGPEKVAIHGKNGAGKTTLVKLLCKVLKPMQGEILLGTDRVRHVDQSISFLDPNLSLIGNFQKLNPEANLQEAYEALAKFLFRNTNAEKLARNLSGGEKIRAGLACSLLSHVPPQFIILDEPTNHLDIRSIECIESALEKFKGAMLAISHDRTFINNIGITRELFI